MIEVTSSLAFCRTRFQHAHHVAASRIHDLAAAFLDLREGLHVGAKGGHDDHVVRHQIAHLGFFVFAEQNS